MTNLIFLLIILIILLGLQIFLSTRKNKWIGLIIPAILFVLMTVFLLFNLNDAFYTIGDFGQFLLDYGTIGVGALIFKIGFIYLPVIISLVIYFICRKVYKSNHSEPSQKEIDKMMAKDLD